MVPQLAKSVVRVREARIRKRQCLDRCKVTFAPLTLLHFSNGKIRFQSLFMLMTVQSYFFASFISESENVPIFESAP